jgi:hypothetical protein
MQEVCHALDNADQKPAALKGLWRRRENKIELATFTTLSKPCGDNNHFRRSHRSTASFSVADDIRRSALVQTLIS